MAYNSEQPSFQILICCIKVWNMKDSSNIMSVPDDVMLISEVSEIEIEESYKKLIWNATVKFPRGTVVRKTITPENQAEIADDPSLGVSTNNSGVIEEVRKNASVATNEMFKPGQRIRIYLGYTDDPEIARIAKTNATGKTIFNDKQTLTRYTEDAQYLSEKAMHIMFDGYITKVSVDTPIELHCENLLSSLKSITCPKKTLAKATINDIIGPDGKLKLLEGTGLKLHSDTVATEFSIGKIDLVPDLTLADVLTEWAKYGIYCYYCDDNGEPAIQIARAYFSSKDNDPKLKGSILNANSEIITPVKILFDYHVAQNGLSATIAEKDFIGVEAEGLASEGGKDKFIHMTILKNPKYKEGDPPDDKYRVVNESTLSKKAMKLGCRPLSKAKDHVDMKLYTKIPYHSRKIPVTRDELLEEAIQYLEGYNVNGIEGSLTLFGDLHLHTATKVELVDNRYPGKNGYYLVEEVNTTFGVDGYRQTIKMPYCIKRIGKTDSENNEQQ